MQSEIPIPKTEVGRNYIDNKVLISYYTKETFCKKAQVGKDQEKVQSEKDSHSKNQGGKKPN